VRLFVFGMGFSGAALARRLRSQGWSIVGAARSPEARSALEAQGVQSVDPADPDDLRSALEGADAVLVTAPPGEAGCPGFAALDALQVEAGWIGYLSTTGVYGDRQGGWVFEETPVDPKSAEAGRRAEAEAQWLGRGAIVFRLPGIYGPGRSVFDRLRQGTARRLTKPGQVFSRIHVDDLATGLEASIRRPRAGAIYNLCDDEPASASRVTEYAARLIGMAPPPEELFAEASVSPMARRFWAESKRVSNAKAKAELGWRPAFPTYREGLAAVLEAERGPAPR
jgi:nucleoside-diphosphate-sugar epimerase